MGGGKFQNSWGNSMLTHARIRTLILASVVCGSHSLSAEEWKTLADEPSRADLFAQYIVPKTRPEEAQSFALLGPFVFPTDTTIDKTKNAARTDVIFGIDISHYEDASIRFDLMRDQNIRFVYVKATQGVGYKDGKFAQFWNAIGALPPEKKVLRGPYHFLASSGDPVAQADSFLKLLNENGGLKPGDLPPVLDLEWDKASAGGPDRWQGHSPDAILNAVLAWLVARTRHCRREMGAAQGLSDLDCGLFQFIPRSRDPGSPQQGRVRYLA